MSELWGRNLPFPIDKAHQLYNSLLLPHKPWYKTEKDWFWSISNPRFSNPRLQSLQSMQEQQAVNKVSREHCSSLFHFTVVLLSALLPIPTVTPWDVTHPHGINVNVVPLSRIPRGIPAVSITVQTSTLNSSLWKYFKTGLVLESPGFFYIDGSFRTSLLPMCCLLSLTNIVWYVVSVV